MATHSRAAGVLAGLLHLGIGVFPLSASGLLAPPWAVVVIGLGWAAAAVVLVVVWRRRPWWALAVPLATLAAWVALLAAGDLWLGWTA